MHVYTDHGAELPRVVGRVLLLAVLTALALTLAIAVVPRLLGFATLVVKGGSMGKAEPIGSLVIARNVPAQQIEVGDVIVLQDGAAALPKIHRVVSVEKHGGQLAVRTKGDANSAGDPNPYALQSQATRVVTAFPYLGYFVSFVTRPLGWLLVIVLPAAILSLSVIRRIWELDTRGPTRA